MVTTDVILAAPLMLLLGGAVFTDIRFHRIPNIFLLFGLICAVVAQTLIHGWSGVIASLSGLAVGLLCFLPMYMFGGMAAGDVKLMAVVGGFLGPVAAFWAAAFSLIAGGVFGVLILLYNKQLSRFLVRYWAMASLRSYIQAEADDAARQRFPYAVAILCGTLASGFWMSVIQ